MDKIIEGIELYPLRQITVPKGNILHALKATDKGFLGFGEAYFSQIEQGAVKGWKKHKSMTLNLVVPVGAIKFVIYDDRKNSLTYKHFYEVTLSSKENYKRLVIAPGLWMAFMGVGEGISMLMDIIPEPHNPDEADRIDLSEIKYDFKS